MNLQNKDDLWQWCLDNKKLIYSTLNRMGVTKDCIEDDYINACIVIVENGHTYNPKSCKMSTFAVKQIKQKLPRIWNKNRIVTFPIGFHERAYKWLKIKDKYINKETGSIDYEKVQKELSISRLVIDYFEEFLDGNKHICFSVDPSDKVLYTSQEKDYRYSLDDDIDYQTLKRKIDKIVDLFPKDIHRQIAIRRYGLKEFEGNEQTIQSIAIEMGCAHQNVWDRLQHINQFIRSKLKLSERTIDNLRSIRHYG